MVVIQSFQFVCWGDKIDDAYQVNYVRRVYGTCHNILSLVDQNKPLETLL